MSENNEKYIVKVHLNNGDIVRSLEDSQTRTEIESRWCNTFQSSEVISTDWQDGVFSVIPKHAISRVEIVEYED